MNVVLINGSPNKYGCTYTALQEVATQLEENNITTKMLHIGTKPTQGCIACHKCFTLGHCVFNDVSDEWASIIQKADGVIVGSPVYYAGPNGSLCSILDRMFFCHGGSFAGKPASSIVSCRRGGASSALDRLNKYFTLSNMPLVTSQYWNMVHGTTPDEVRQDKEGLQTMRTLGKNMAWLLQSIKLGNVAPFPAEPITPTNFIR